MLHTWLLARFCLNFPRDDCHIFNSFLWRIATLAIIEKFPEKTLGPGSGFFFKFVRYLGWQIIHKRALTKFGYLSKEENRKSLGNLMTIHQILG
jgi:hypothetical protein